MIQKKPEIKAQPKDAIIAGKPKVSKKVAEIGCEFDNRYYIAYNRRKC